MKRSGEWNTSPRAHPRRLGAEEAKRREGLRAAEAQAQDEGRGIWSKDPESVRERCGRADHSNERFRSRCLPTRKRSSRNIRERRLTVNGTRRFALTPAIVEQVRDGTLLRVRLLLEDGNHQFINLVGYHVTHLTDRPSLEPRALARGTGIMPIRQNHLAKRQAGASRGCSRAGQILH